MRKVVTVTLNPAIDLTVRIDRLIPGTVHRALGHHSEAGGKGVGVASVLAALGVPVVVSGWLGADNSGLFEAAFLRRGIADEMLRLPGNTRTNVKLADLAHQDTTDINLPGLALDGSALAAAEARLAERLDQLLAPGDWCALAGSLPPGADTGCWLRLARRARARGARLVIDTGGAELAQLLQALQAPLADGRSALPALIKPNRAELEQLVGHALPTLVEVAEAATVLQAGGVERVVVSLGSEGAVIVGDAGRWFAQPPPVDLATTVGAGDALVAGTLAALLEGRRFPDAAVFGMACAAARIQRIAPELPPRAEIDALAAGIAVQSL